MPPDDAAELLALAADLLGDRDAVAGLAGVTARYRDELDAEASAPRWKEGGRQLARLRAASRAFRLAVRDLSPGTLAFCGLADVTALAPAVAGTVAAERLAVEAEGRLARHAPDFVNGGRKRLRRGPSARWRLALACAELLDRRRPGSVSGARNGGLHELTALLHQVVTGDVDERGVANACGQVGKLWRDRRLALQRAARLPDGDPERGPLLAEAEHLTRVLEQGK